MCWSYEVSLVTGLTATALSIYLLMYGKGNDIPIALVSITIALMQFAEALMWNEDTRGGQLGLLALFLQPLALGLGILWIRGWMWGVIGFAALWGILAIPTLRSLLSKKWPISVGNCGHLQWSFLNPMLESSFAPLYWIVMMGGWLFLQPFEEGVHYAFIAIGTLGITWKVFPGEWGSLWCWIANALPLGRILF